MTVVVLPLVGSWSRDSDGLLMPVWIKDPDDVEDYTLGFANHLVSDDQIVAVTFKMPASDPALNLLSTNITDSLAPNVRTDAAATGWFSGGTLGVQSNIICRITTLHGRQHDRTFAFLIAQK